MFQVNDEVVRNYPNGHKDHGKVVEVNELSGRVRVYWHTYSCVLQKPKRTWVNHKIIQKV